MGIACCIVGTHEKTCFTCLMISGMPAVGAAITGTFEAWASRIDKGNPSEVDGKRKKSAARNN